MTDNTIVTRPLPKRPETGLQAWLATVGYLGAEYSPDAMLTLRVTPVWNDDAWFAAVSWAQETVTIENCESLEQALRDLWRSVEREHKVFRTLEAATRRPANYPEDRWVDADTRATLARLLDVMRKAFARTWSLIIVYQPVENPTLRVQMRLVARGSQVNISGSGPTIRDGCNDLYRNITHNYLMRDSRPADGTSDK